MAAGLRALQGKRVGGRRIRWRSRLCHPAGRAVAELAQHRVARLAFDERGTATGRTGAAEGIHFPRDPPAGRGERTSGLRFYFETRTTRGGAAATRTPMAGATLTAEAHEPRRPHTGPLRRAGAEIECPKRTSHRCSTNLDSDRVFRVTGVVWTTVARSPVDYKPLWVNVGVRIPARPGERNRTH